MKKLTSLENLYSYLESLKLDNGVIPFLTTDNTDATGCLATASGTQVLFARPEAALTCKGDGFSYTINTLIFVLEKGLGTANTKTKENAQYRKLRNIAEDILAILERDTSNNACTLLKGLVLSKIEVVPVTSVFGGWLGYSIEIEFE